MQIEIARPERMSITGSSLFNSIQNKHTPILDLLVRESVQNSLDAAQENARHVNVNFILGTFSPIKVNNLLEGVSEKLNERYSDNEYDFIAIRDSNTVGLTGPLHYDDINEGSQNYGNLLKLVYEISKPQTQEGAGGSWGLGKTVYFRVGKGLVFFYSRIRNEKGEYESRFAAALIENEHSPESVIPSLKNSKIKRGIAWWGVSRGENSTLPLTNEEEIKEILSYFGVPPYQEDATGTTVIIPYINKRELLNDNRPNAQDDDNSTEKYQPAPWYNSVEDYLRIAIQRWYIPRLNNLAYNGTYLNAAINGKKINTDDIEPIFAIYQDLYNIGTDDNAEQKEDCQFEDIKIRGVLTNSSIAGRVIFKKVSRRELKMTVPDNKPRPEMYCNQEIRHAELNKPIFAFTRKPGMIISYKNEGFWLDGVQPTDENHFLIALFVLKSDNSLKECGGISLEEYIRKSELADHTSWKDHSNQKIISKIQNGVSKKLSIASKEQDDNSQITKDSTFSKILGDLILPKIGFGKKPGTIKNKPNGNIRSQKDGGILFSIDLSKTEYAASHMVINAEWSSKSALKRAALSLAIDSENNSISANEWENSMGLEMPFEIEDVSVLFTKLNKEKHEVSLHVSKDSIVANAEQCCLNLSNTPKGFGNVINLLFEEATQFSSKIKIRLKILDEKKNKKPTFILERDR